MARAPKKTPGNGGMPDHGDIRTAAAMEMIFEAKEKDLRDQKKKARLRLVEGKGLLADDTKFLKSLRDKTGSEVIDVFSRQWHMVGAFFPEQHGQMDLFTKKSEAPVRAAYFTMGLLAGLQGKDLEVPPMVAGDDRQQMIAGHNEGRERYAAAQADLLSEAVNAPEGTVADGRAAAVAKRAAEDFAKDTGDDPLIVDGVKYDTMRQANAARARKAAKEGAGQAPAGDQAGAPDGNQGTVVAPEGGNDVVTGDGTGDALPPVSDGTFLNDTTTCVIGDDTQPAGGAGADLIAAPPVDPMRKTQVARPGFHEWDDDFEKWTGPQSMEFRRWFDGLPENIVPAISHTGAVAFFNKLRQDRIDAQREADEAAFEASKPKAPEPAMDEASIAAAAKKLQERGFAPTKRQRKTHS